MNGIIIVDKPRGWTSHDVVNRVRRILGQRSVGHLGTLDPLATGVLPLVVGNLTRLAQFYISSEKTYQGVIRFGFATTTYDADGDAIAPNSSSSHPDPLSSAPTPLSSAPTPLSSAPNPLSSRPEHGFAEGEAMRSGGTLRSISHLALDHLQLLAAQFVGVIEQIPPPFSAKKIHGVPAYKLARKHKEFDLKPVQVEIKEFTITSLENDRARFHARVASGTYMRSVAHDLGQRLGCGAHLESLRRTQVAEFDISQAHTLEEIEQVTQESSSCHPGRSLSLPAEQTGVVEATAILAPPRSSAISDLFIHPRQLLPGFPCVTADESTASRIRNGRPVNLPELSRARYVKVFASQTDLIAIAARVAGSLFHPKIVFPLE